MRSLIPIIIWIFFIININKVSKNRSVKHRQNHQTFVNKIASDNNIIRLDNENISSYEKHYNIKRNKKVNPWSKSNMMIFRNRVNDVLGKTDYPLHGKLSQESREDEKDWF